MPVTGSFAELGKLIAAAGLLSDAQFRVKLSRNLAAEAQSQVAEGFQQQRDPYGKPWKPNKRGGRTLQDTGRLKNAWAGAGALHSVSAEGFRLTNATKYADIHQRGGTIKPKNKPALRFQSGGGWVSAKRVVIPQRMMIPEHELGPIWEKGFKEAATAYTRAVVVKGQL